MSSGLVSCYYEPNSTIWALEHIRTPPRNFLSEQYEDMETASLSFSLSLCFSRPRQEISSLVHRLKTLDVDRARDSCMWGCIEVVGTQMMMIHCKMLRRMIGCYPSWFPASGAYLMAVA